MMPARSPIKLWILSLTPLVVMAAISCAPEYRPWFLGGTGGQSASGAGVFAGPLGNAFTEVLIQGRTFVQGQVVTTVAYAVSDMTRTPLGIDFNNDGRLDPVVGYQQGNLGVAQILLSYEDTSTSGVHYASVTIDGGENEWNNLQDLAVGDIDNDGALDVVLATSDGIIYLHHPSSDTHTHIASEWGQDIGELEIIEGTTSTLSPEELEALVFSVVDESVNPDYYIPVYEAVYTAVDIADFDNDGHNDIIATRQQRIELRPLPTIPVDPIVLESGSLQLLLNPGNAQDGQYWTGFPIGLHERHDILDRLGASDLRPVDLDGDGDLDIITVASDDQNVQIAWFENRGGPGVIDPTTPWTQHRIGSVLGASRIDVADVTGDNRPDVIATSPTQMQIVLFVHPEADPDRDYDWYSSAIVTFDSYEPRVIQALDVDNDGVLEITVGGATGEVRYFEPPTVPTNTWSGTVVLTFDPAGVVGQLGYGDLDGDGDADLVAVVGTAAEEGSDGGSEGLGDVDPTGDRVTWIRNGLR
jgi:hypothetical protein